MTSGASHPPAEPATKITIVVPIYGDWPSLRACIASIIDHADPARFDVLLVNDCGPDATVIEAGVVGMILGRPNFRYERNPRNLGFVQACNRAVFELDTTGNDVLLLNSDTVLSAGALEELVRVLALSPSIGAVCPRSNDATIASIPFFRRDRHEERSVTRARDVHAAIAPELPEYTVAPVAIGFCFLTRRTLIEKYGLFDEIFGRGYNEENDYCLRLNENGYSSVIANRAFVEHAGSASFGSTERSELERTNAKILHERYPYYPGSVATFIHHGYDAVDRFADLLVSPRQQRRMHVVLDISGFTPPSDAPDAEAVALTLALLLDYSPEESVALSVLGSAEQLRMLGIDPANIGAQVIDPSDAEEIFDAGVIVSDVSTVDQLDRLRRCCLRWVVMNHARAAEATRDIVESPLNAICNDEARALANFVVDAEVKDARGAATVWTTVTKMVESPVDYTALRDRDRRLSNLTRAWQHERARADELERRLARTADGMSARLGRGLRRVVRR